jgi:diguanylate cyclase (GGDEF)-like protein
VVTGIPAYIGSVMLLALAYLVTAFIGVGAGLHEQIIQFWAPAGVALAAVLRFGPGLLPGVLLGNLAFNLLLPLTWNESLTIANVVTALVIASGACIQTAVASGLVQRFHANPLAPGSGRALFLFALLAGPGSCLINATIGTSAVTLLNDAAGSAGFLSDWLSWWIGDSFGAIVVTPLVLALLPGGGSGPKQRRSVVLRLSGIIAVAILLNSLFMMRLNHQLVRDFERDSRLIEAQLFSAVQKNLADLAHLGQYFAEPGGLSPQAFRDEVLALTESNPSVRAYSWDPIIAQHERAEFEAHTSALIGEPYAIYGDSIAADDPLIPVQFVEPRESNRAAYGFNLLSLEDRRRWVLLAQETGDPVATEILHLTQAPDQPGFLILHPVYQLTGEMAPLSRQRRLVGFMVGVFTVDQLLNGALADLDSRNIDLALRESPDGEPFYTSAGFGRTDHALQSRFHLQVGQRDWYVSTTPGADYMAAHPSSNALDLQAMLAISAVVAALLVLSMHDRERILLAEVSRQTRSLAYQARHDDLTELPNRAHLLETVHNRIADGDAQPFALLFIDLDRFKLVNDSLGHQVGDRLLQQLAQLLATRLSSGSQLYRMGGDEFILLVEGDRQRACNEADRVLIACTLPVDIDGVRLQVTASIGISLFPDHGADLDTLIKHADTAMYRAKAHGKNRYVVYTEELTDLAFRSFSLEQDLRLALAEKQLVLHYQPQFDLQNMTLVGSEALVRWQHPEHGLLGPGQFIELAEETQLIIPLGWQVIEMACEQMQLWDSDGINMPCVAINISPQQLLQVDFVERLNALVDRYGVARDRIELEITELMIMQDPDLAMMQLHGLRESGYRIALDDFGTGYSSLDRLKRLPLNRLKIDQAFTRDIGKNPRDEAVILTIIALGRSLGIEVLAEGVETEAQQAFLARNACDSVQGYLLGRPVAPEQLRLKT